MKSGGHTLVSDTPSLATPDLGRLQRDFEALSGFREPGLPGWTRRVFSEADGAARAWLADAFAQAGLRVSVDAAGNLIGDLEGQSSGPAIVTGSHTDTVAGGGRYDGIVGVLAAIEMVRVMRAAGVSLRSPLRIVDFLGEEPNEFGLSCVGSRAVAGALYPEHLRLRDASGASLAEALARVGNGGDPASARWRSDDVAAFVELHVEQGPRLAEEGVPLAVVSAIAGIHRVGVTFTGQPDHAGTTPMARRHDALCAAAEAILAVEAIADVEAVATTGRLQLEPGATNVVPGMVRIWAEFRSPSEQWLDGLEERVADAVARAAGRRGVSVSIEWFSAVAPVPTHPLVREAARRAIHGLGQAPLELYSGAGHDAAHMAVLAPMGMLFVPSIGGRSHCPEEETHMTDVARGVEALAATVLELDRQLAPAQP
jgi:N-carbamoyl-L-amino-acid hydrolase